MIGWPFAVREAGGRPIVCVANEEIIPWARKRTSSNSASCDLAGELGLRAGPAFIVQRSRQSLAQKAAADIDHGALAAQDRM